VIEQKPKPLGVFSKQNIQFSNIEQPSNLKSESETKKVDFKEPSLDNEISKSVINKTDITPEDNKTYDDIEKINKNFDKSLDSSLYDDIDVDSDDLKIAEKILFDGYAETDVSIANFPDNKFTICSTSAEEIDLIQEIIFDICKEHETNDDRIDMPQTNIRAMNNALFIAISYRGMNKKELCENPIEYLNTIKKAIIKVDSFINEGNIKAAKELKDSLKKSLRNRVSKVRRLPTPVIDFISNEKNKFDKKISKIFSMKNIIPKS
jgi:hypothetical protein